jgi:predicted AAA+ superfamily ATPase
MRLNIYHYRTQRGKEIDLILQRTPFSTPIAIEIKSASSPSKDDVKELVRFSEEYPETKAFVFCKTQRSYKQGRIIFINFLEGLKELTKL